MSHPVIQVERVSKRYRVGSREPYHRFSELLSTAGRKTIASPVNLFRRAISGSTGGGLNGHAQSNSNDFWALRDISFEVQEGEVLGIIGHNGAGKSTLLKILSRITEPTEGRFGLRGRVASLLEVGTGFHPELTGRDNIYLNAAILGMARPEIRRRFDEIVAFAEVEPFLDTPVKHYSSGMHMRLAFAVAAHLEPEILIVDEVLAVGDLAFQKKCIGRMDKVAREGRTVLLVSHDLNSIASLAPQCILLDCGKLIGRGNTAGVIELYTSSQRHSAVSAYEAPPSPDSPAITRVELMTSDPGNIHRYGLPLRVCVEIVTPRPVVDARLTLQIVNSRGCPTVCLWTFDAEQPMLRSPGVYRASCVIESPRLYWGQYTLTVWLGDSPIRSLCPFEISMHELRREIPWPADACVYLEDGVWTVNEVTADATKALV